MITKYLMRLKIWWMDQESVGRAFYLINTTTQIILILAPIAVIDTFADSWWEANPDLFNVLVLPFLFGWLASLMAARWVISTVLVWYYDTAAEIVDKISNKIK